MWNVEILWERLRTPLFEGKRDIEMRTRANLLVRMATAGRNGDVANILRSSVTFYEDRFSFRYFQWKTQKRDATRLSRVIVIKRLSGDNKFRCAYTAMATYMGAMDKHYKNHDPKSPWISFTTKNDVTKKQLANNARQAMEKAGIAAHFDADSIRHAVITYWRKSKIPKDQVLERTGHRSKSLVDFYYDKSDNADDLTADIIEREDLTDQEEISEDEEFDEDDDQITPISKT